MTETKSKPSASGCDLERRSKGAGGWRFFVHEHKKAWSQSGLCDHVELVNVFGNKPLSLHPNPNCNPTQVVAIWKGGARERADDAFLCVSIKKCGRKANFATTW